MGKHPSQDLKVQRATFCYPKEIPNLELSDATCRRFGNEPILLVGVSGRFYERFGESDHEHPVRLVTIGVGDKNVLVLLLQCAGHQLRCVMPLRRPPVQRMVDTMRQRGTLAMVLFEADGHRFAGLECEVQKEDVDAVCGNGLPSIVPAAACRPELTYLALTCLLREEMASVVPGEMLHDVDVALVEEKAFLVITPLN